MKKKVSMQQIADAVGLSKYAVSKALAGKEGVSAKTREKIFEAATQFGYFKQQKAASEISEKPKNKTGEWTSEDYGSEKRTVAILMPSVRLQTMDSAFWSVIVHGISLALSRYGLGMLIITEQTAEHFEMVLKPDRLLGVIGVGEVSTNMLLEIQRLDLPFVLTDHEDSLVPSDSVFASNIDSMALITGHLLALGHRSFWFLGDTQFSRSFMDRWIGFRKALEEHAIIVDPVRDKLLLSGTDREAIHHTLQDKLDSLAAKGAALPTAWVCANDEIALSALSLLKKRGISVPSEICLTGFDNIDESQRAEVPLTTVHVKKEQLGERSVAALLDRIRHPQSPFEKINIACDLVVRASSGSRAT
ncbi:LacI family DNA-binding transcriptional regulator [Paenibacillus andongensis]|uniref:LacI family DNA-binding transcriptional regulator n=1 Tax=Paenibacillus andongensis TaxID=2975482 RepID=UPI0021BBADBC|nr:LacI family DNA-binding transcriptional regulator [Paenibacillus andongensis]